MAVIQFLFYNTVTNSRIESEFLMFAAAGLSTEFIITEYLLHSQDQKVFIKRQIIIRALKNGQRHATQALHP